MPDMIPSAQSLMGKALRLPLRLVPDGLEVPILLGPGRGLRWIKGSGPHSMWLGFNEARKRCLFSQLVKPGQVVFDIGAHVGSYSLLASRLVGPEGIVFAFEPLSENLEFLRKHLKLNHISNVVIQPQAVWDRTGPVRFRAVPDRVSSRVHELGELEVPATTLDEIVESGDAPPPNCIKIDVEGGEVHVLRGGLETLSQHRPILFVSTHGDATDGRCREVLERLRYSVRVLRPHHDELLCMPDSNVFQGPG